MSNITAATQNDINDILNLELKLWNEDISQVESDEINSQLFRLIVTQGGETIYDWLESKSLMQCYLISQRLPESGRETLYRFMPSWLKLDMEKIQAQIHPIISSVSLSPILCFTEETQIVDAIAKIQATSEEHDSQFAFVLDERGRYRSLLPLHQLVKHNQEQTLGDIALCVPSCHASTDREAAVTMLQDSEAQGLPLVDLWGVPVGLLHVKEAMEVMQQEQTQDVEMLMGIQGSDYDTSYMETSVLEHVRKRIFWILGLAGVGILSGMVIQSYDDAITALAILALYMPMVADTGGNAGSQAATVIVRSMALGELKLRDWSAVLWKELRVSLFIGLGLALLSFGKVYYLSFGALLPDNITLSMLGCAISLALFFQVVTATVIGAALPLMAKMCRQDPAVVASPAITTIVDITGLLIYFYVTSLILLS